MTSKSSSRHQKYIMMSKVFYDVEKFVIMSKRLSLCQKYVIMSKICNDVKMSGRHKVCHDVKYTSLCQKFVMMLKYVMTS